ERVLINNEEYLDNIELMHKDTNIENVESSILDDNTDSLDC
ncbi:22674_t:CDS:1, partial [Gigaspora rosea]